MTCAVRAWKMRIKEKGGIWVGRLLFPSSLPFSLSLQNGVREAPGSSFNVQCGTRIFFNIQHNISDFTLHFAFYNKCYFKK